MAPAIEVRGVSKHFRLYHEKYTSLKERVIHLGRVPFEEFNALEGVDLVVDQGETFGLLGHNGSGKSTLLKCIAGILRPSEGEIVTVGRVAAMLELGTGFHPDLTGRDNVFMNASLLGLGRREIEAKFDDIVAFAELEDFIDQPVRHYSSGMYVRLGFAVAVHMDPDILLVDEVLAVGDEAFQSKCLGRIKEFQAEGRTIMIVTHSADTVPQVCDRAGVLDHGRLLMEGPPGLAVRTLRERLFALDPDGAARGAPEGGVDLPPDYTYRVRIREVVLDHPGRPDREHLLTGEPLRVSLHYSCDASADEPVENAVFCFAIYDEELEQLFGTNTEILGAEVGSLAGDGTVTFSMESVPFLDGRYFVSTKITNTTGSVVHDWRPQREHFEVVNPGRTVGRVHIPMEVEVVHGTEREAAAG